MNANKWLILNRTIHIIILLLWEFFTPTLLMLFFLLESEWKQVSRTLLSIPADIHNAVVSMVSTCPLISQSFSPLTNTSGIIPSAPTTIGITVTFMYHSFWWFFTFLLFVSGFPVFFVLANILISSMYMRSLIFPGDFCKFVAIPLPRALSMCII